MTQPPPQQPGPFGQDPYGQQPGQQGQPNQPGQYGQQQPGQYGESYPQTGPQPGQPWGTPPQGFSQQQQPYGQFDGNQGYQQGYPGYPGGQPPKKTGLIVGLVALGVLVVGGIVALILILTSSDDDNSASGGPSASNKASSKPSTSARTKPAIIPSNLPVPPIDPLPGTGGTGGTTGGIGTGAAAQPTPDALTSYLATAYTGNDKNAVVSAFCLGTSVTDSTFLPAPQLGGAPLPASVQGTTATLKVKITDQKPGGEVNGVMNFNAQQSNGAWCLTKIARFTDQ